MLRAVTGLANVKFRVDRIEVFAVEMLLYDSQTFTKTLIMHDLTFSKEADRITYFRDLSQAAGYYHKWSGPFVPQPYLHEDL